MFKEVKKTSPQTRLLVERLRGHMEQSQINARELAERAEVGRSFVYDILNGKSTNPTTQKLASVAKVLGVSVSTLLYGEDALTGQQGVDVVSEEVRDMVTVSSIAVEASMGGGTLVTEEVEDKPFFFRKSWIRERLKVSPSELRVIRVRGDSMQPALSEGDVVLVDLTRARPSPPGIFVLFDGQGLMVKRLELLPTGGQVRVISDNPSYSAYTANPEDIRIIGRVVWYAREMV